MAERSLFLLLTLLLSLGGMACWALALDVHWRQVRADNALLPRTARRLRAQGTGALLASLLCCLAAEHASMAALVWIMTLTASALSVTFVLARRPRWLAFLAR